MNKDITYESAFEEVKSIINELETGNPKVEDLGKMAKRASELLQICQEKLRGIEQEVDSSLNKED